MTMQVKLNAPNVAELCITNSNGNFRAVPIERNLKAENRLARLHATLPYQAEYLKGTFADELWQAMEHRHVNQVQFANKANVTKQFLTKVFRGGNCTLETIAKLSFALNYKCHIHLTPNEVGCGWIHGWLSDDAKNPRPPERFFKLWSESGYEDIQYLETETDATVTSPS